MWYKLSKLKGSQYKNQGRFVEKRFRSSNLLNKVIEPDLLSGGCSEGLKFHNGLKANRMKPIHLEEGELQMIATKEVNLATTTRQATTKMTSSRKIALTAGLLYLLTFVSIPTISLYGAVHAANYITGAGPDTAAIIGGILEIIVALAGIGTAIVLFPVLKKQNEGAALGLVASRILEASTMFAGVAFILSIVSLRQAGAGADGLVTGHALVTLYDRIFLLGQSFMPAVNDLLLGYLLYRSRLVPRVISVVGMFAAVPLVAGYLAMMFGLFGLHAPLAGLSAFPVAIFEFSVGVWLTVKGFNRSAATSLSEKA
jgi:hypothetical protein